MTRISDFVPGMLGIFKGQPWHMNMLIVIGVIITGLIIFAVLIFQAEITKALFAADFMAICICIYECCEEGHVDINAGISLAVFMVLLAGLFFILCGTEEYYVSIPAIFFCSLLKGFVNIMIVFACCTLVLIPLAAAAWGQNDRYS